MFIEVHMIQNFVPSNLNRDDLGNPKECEFGAARRARISSQCLKRAIRTADVFKATTGVEESIRTRYLTRKIREGLKENDKPEEVTRIARAVAAAYSSKKKQMDSEKPDRTKVALYLSAGDIQWLVARLEQQWDALLQPSDAVTAGEDGEKPTQKARKESATSPLEEIVGGLIEHTAAHTDAPDIALFGRMLADRPETNVDAACQMAHAISTHELKAETDFFTAVEMLPETDETGAAMMDYANFNSACFYRYARVDWEQLVNNLKSGEEPSADDIDLAHHTVEGFLRAMVEAVPSGKVNAHAHYNPPSFVLAVVRSGGMAWSLANAFERPVKANGAGLVTPSIKALDRYWGRLSTAYDAKTLQRVAVFPVDDDYELKALQSGDDSVNILVKNWEEWIGAVLQELPGREA